MRNKYIYRQTVESHRRARFKRSLRLMAVFLLIVIVVGVIILLDLLRDQPEQSRVSNIQTVEVSGNMYTTVAPYFKFQDTSKWVLDSARSKPDTFIYTKYRKLNILAQVTVYVNRVPIPLELATPRVLPVRPVNNNSFDVTLTSDPCGRTYNGAPHIVKPVTINNATMLCDPDSPLYLVQFAMIGGDWRLNLKRPDGTPIQFVIIYRETTPELQPQTVIRIAKSFQTR